MTLYASIKNKFNPLALNWRSILLFVFIFIFTLDRHHRYEITTDPALGPFEYDVGEYYSFLPKFFYGTNEQVAANFYNNKRTIGMAFLYLPSFLVGDIVARFSNQPLDGYSEPYQWAVRWGSIFISLIGLLFCRKNLLRYFNDQITLITLVIIFFGTNLFYYTYCTGEMPHGYLFSLYAILIHYTFKFILDSNQTSLLPIAIILSLIILIRPTDIVILLFPLIFKVNSYQDFKDRIRLVFRDRMKFIAALFLFVLPWLIQIALWKKYNDAYFFYSYGREKFYFNDPQIFNFLFSFRKGWFIYTPLMIFSFVGLLFVKKSLKDFFYFLISFNILNIYILSSWWDWGYGGSFGNRALVQSYAVLVFPLALFVKKLLYTYTSHSLSQKLIKICSIAILWFFIKLNLFQIWQSKYLLIHWSGMNKAAYQYVLFKESLTDKELKFLHNYLFTPPDSEAMINGQRD